MMNLIGRVMSQISSTFRGTTWEEKTEIARMDSLVSDCRSHAVKAVCDGDECSQIIQNLIELDCPSDLKYDVLKVEDLLQQNNESVEDLKHITSGLALIVKFAQHLIKPLDQRKPQWRHIVFNKPIVENKLKPMNGFESILAGLGYTQPYQNGVCFPEGQETCKEVIVTLIVDMMLFRKEVKEFILRRHPHPEWIQKYVPQQTLDELLARELSGEKCEDEDPSEVSSCQSSVFDQSHSQSKEQAQATNSQMLEQNNNNNSAGGQSKHYRPAPPRPAHPPLRNVSDGNSHSPVAQPEHSEDVVLAMNHAVAQFYSDSRGVQPEDEALNNVESQNIQEAIPDFVEEEDMAVPQGSSGIHTSSHSNRFACTVCGDEATGFCKDCYNKTLCDSCNSSWHKHPQRRNHKMEKISDLGNLPLENSNTPHVDGPYGITAQTKEIRERVSKKQQTLVVGQKSSSENLATATQPTFTMDQSTPYQGNKFEQNQTWFQGPVSSSQSVQQPDDFQILDHQKRLGHKQQPYITQMSGSSSPDLKLSLYQGQLQGQFYPPGQGPTYFQHPTSLQQPRQGIPQPGSVMMKNFPYSQEHQLGPPPYMLHQMNDLRQGKSSPGMHSSPSWPEVDQSTYPYQSMVQPQAVGGHNINPSYMQDYNSAVHHHAFPNPAMYHQQPRFNNQYSTMSSYAPQLGHPRNAFVQQGHEYFAPQMSLSNTPGREHAFYEGNMGLESQHFSRMPTSVNPTSIAQTQSVSNPPQIRRSSSASSGSSYENSFYVRCLLEEPDLKKRLEKCNNFIEKFSLDLEMLESEINESLLSEDNFHETPKFRDLSQRKAKMMKEKLFVEMCRDRTSENQGDGMPEIYFPPEIKSPSQSVRQNSANVRNATNTPVQSERNGCKVFSQADQHEKEKMNSNNSAVISIAPTSKGFSVKPSTPSTMSRPTEAKIVTVPSEILESKAQANSSPRLPVEDSNIDEGLASTPPALPPRPKQPAENPENLLNKTFSPPRVVALSAIKQWECEHCTFINGASAHACVMCHKTSINPKLVSLSDDENINGDENINPNEAEEATTEEKSLADDTFIDLLNELQKEQEEGRKGEDEKEYDQEYELDPEETQVATVPSRILGCQQQVMLEKKRAHEEFDKQQLQESTNIFSPAALASPQRMQSPSPTTSHGIGARPKHASTSPKPAVSPTEQRQTSSSSEFVTPPSSNTPSPPNSTRTLPKSALHNRPLEDATSRRSSEHSLEESLAKLNEAKLIDQIQENGAKLSKWVKMADKEGYDIEAVQIACNFCEQLSKTPLEWLEENWKKNVSKIMAMAKAEGKAHQQNSVGEFSFREAESAYVSCHGNMKEAAQMCVEKRLQLYQYLSGLGEFPREEILQKMMLACGDQEVAESLLLDSTLCPFINHIWAQKEPTSSDRMALQNITGSEMDHSFSTSVITHLDFQNTIKDKHLPLERRIRMILVEGRLKSWGRAELVIKILDQDLSGENITLEDVVEAVRNCQDRLSAIAYLQQECEICFTNFPMSKIRNLNICQCKMCEGCLTKNFEIAIREKHLRLWMCPLCSLPDLNDTEVASDYLQFLGMLLQPLIDREVQNLFETKIRDWHLQNDPNFRWCAHCNEGFLAENRRGQLRMTCPYCQKQTCFSCKKMWEDQHEGLTCEEFKQWKIDNDPTNQSVGLAKHLDENGIDCPACHMRFALAKGGCMHFTCPQCGYEFCSGCNEPYHQKDVCQKYKSCKKLGLHCHCPRDCYSYLRDFRVDQLQQLLKNHNVPFNVEAPADQEDTAHCPVMEQKELEQCKKDEKCGKDSAKGHAGLCEVHYKEYLVCIINRSRLDPVHLMTIDEIIATLKRADLPVPQQKQKDDVTYRAILEKIIKEKLPQRR